MVETPPLRECPVCDHHVNWEDRQAACTGCDWWVTVVLDGWSDLDRLPAPARERVARELRSADAGDVVAIE